MNRPVVLPGRILFLLFFIFNSNYVLSQKKGSLLKEFNLVCYLPNGEKYEVQPKTTYGQLKKQFEREGRVWDAYLQEEECIVSFKSFTKTPLFVLILNDKKYSTEKIQSLIKSVNDDVTGYSYYWGINKNGFVADVKQFIEKEILDVDFILNSMGLPSEVKNTLYDGKPVICYIYNKFDIRIYIVNKTAIGYELIE